jgi:hypothetical protein
VQRSLRWWSEVSWIMAWLARHDLVILLADPDVLADEVIRHRIFATVELDDRHVLTYATRHTEGSGERFGRQRVEPFSLLSQPLDRRAARGAMRSRAFTRSQKSSQASRYSAKLV